MERGGTQGIQFVVQIILARLLLPADYGLIALITIFIAIANVFVQNGFNSALIQKKDATDIDFSSVFYLSLFVASILYVIIFFATPFISALYKEPQLIPVLRITSVTLFAGAFNSIQNAIVSRNMQFKKLFFSSLGSTLVSGLIGIILAYANFGVWSLVVQQIISQFSITIILWFTVKWRPKFMFSFRRLGCLFSYGWKLLFSALLDTLYNNIYGLIIGKIYDSKMLGYYNRGDQFPNILVTNINGSISSVLLPAMSANQDDKNMVKNMVRRSIVTSSFVIFPLMIGLAVCAESLVKILLTDKWMQCVPFLQMLCLSYLFWPIHTANLQAINALGRSDIYLKLEIIKKCIGIAALCISIPFGIYIMVVFKIITSFISTIINSFPNKKLLDYSFGQQWKDIVPSLFLSLIMGGIVYTIKFFGMSSFLTLFIQIIIGLILYVGMAFIFKLECYRYLVDTIKSYFQRNEI
jgi:Membrane protein involved in the export of O-antigen and teichoic acid